ncbi:MAG: HAMP domain-containing sensor histidine kinase, partial [Ornithinibacter sp.]
MTLRRRLLLATSALAVVLLLAGAAVLLVQRAFLLDRLDAQLQGLTNNPRALVLASQRAPDGGLSAGLGDVYVGRMGADGRLVTLLTPTTDPTLVPDVAPGESITSPTGRATTSGDAARVRVVTAPLPNGRASAVIALPTTSVDAATRSLALTLALVGLIIAAAVGLLLWWVDRLGLRPIAQMTEAADAIRTGDTSRRVPPGPPDTEAARLGEALNAMIDAEATTRERMRRFVADASHELRTPLTTLQGYAALHTGRAGSAPAVVTDEAEVRDAMRRMGDEAARMRRLVDGLLDLARLDDLEGTGGLAMEPV